MPSRLPRLFTNVVTLVVVGAVLFVASRIISANPVRTDVVNGPQTAAVQSLALPATTSTGETLATTTITEPVPIKETVGMDDSTPIQKKVQEKVAPFIPMNTMQSTLPSAESSDQFHATRITNPYPTPPIPFDRINASTRSALVNILCMPHGGSMRPISGTGVMIDPRGVILTNAHVAQYVLLSEAVQVNLVCSIRTGSPATPRWRTEVLYMPEVWAREHAAEINANSPIGTGAHDYALLRITQSLDGSPLPAPFAFLPFDMREAIGFPGDSVLGAAYPAEFIGGIGAQNNLYAVSSVSAITQLLTLGSGTTDLISIGSVIEAQSGSSGGAAVNAWGQLIGIITTVSEGQTTAERNLRALTMSYINRDLQAQTGHDLAGFLEGDLAAKEAEFNQNVARGLLDQYAKYILK